MGQPRDSGHGREQENAVSSSGNGNIARQAAASSSNGKPNDPEAGRALFESAQWKGSTGIVGTGRGDLSGRTDLLRKVVGPTNDRGGKKFGSSENTEEDRARMIGTTVDRDSVGWAHQEEREGRGRGRGIRHSDVPDWERPSKAEVEDILLGQVCLDVVLAVFTIHSSQTVVPAIMPILLVYSEKNYALPFSSKFNIIPVSSAARPAFRG